MATVFIPGIGGSHHLHAVVTNTLLDLDVSKFYEVRGFFALEQGEDVTITLQVVRPDDPNETPTPDGGTVIGTLDTFHLSDNGQPLTRIYTTPGLWLRVLGTTEFSAHLSELSFIGWEPDPVSGLIGEAVDPGEGLGLERRR
jgi:hypothetical protein